MKLSVAIRRTYISSLGFIFLCALGRVRIAHASTFQTFTDYRDSIARSAGFGANTDLFTTIAAILAIIFSLLGILFFGLMLYGGFLWMTAQGSSEQVDKAKDLIRNAIIGLVVVFGAYIITATIVYLVGSKFGIENLGNS